MYYHLYTIIIESCSTCTVCASDSSILKMWELGTWYREKFLAYAKHYVEDMGTFTALAKKFSTKFFCNTKVNGIGEIFFQQIYAYGIPYFPIVR